MGMIIWFCTTPSCSKRVVYKPTGAEHAADRTIAESQMYHCTAVM